MSERTDTDQRRHHWYKDDIDWGGSGTPGDPWVQLSWEMKRCTCDRPWRH